MGAGDGAGHAPRARARVVIAVVAQAAMSMSMLGAWAAFAATTDNNYIEYGALSVLMAVLVWIGKRSDSDTKVKARLEGENRTLRKQVADERVAKHDAIGRESAALLRASLLRGAGLKCTCTAMDGVRALLEEEHP